MAELLGVGNIKEQLSTLYKVGWITFESLGFLTHQSVSEG
ncbi:MAG: hypothetical protein ACI8WW_000588 [Oceanospirillaceae bacterium]|jgi:hypothetical protein